MNINHVTQSKVQKDQTTLAGPSGCLVNCSPKRILHFLLLFVYNNI